jgi:hypothetical protein
MNSYYFWVFLLSVSIYLVYTDASIARFVDLMSRLIKFQYEKTKWWLIHNPQNPVVKYLMWRRALKLAKELQDEIQMERQSRQGNNNSKTIE